MQNTGAGNSYLTDDRILKEAMFQYKNNLVACRNVYRSMEKQLAQKIGNQISIKKPFRSKSTEGRTLGKTAMIDNSVTLLIDRQRNVGLEFTIQDRTLSIQDFSERYIKPAIGEIATLIDKSIFDVAAQTTYFHSGSIGSALTATSIMYTKANVNNVAIPDDGNRIGMLNEIDAANISADIKTVFNEGMVEGAIKKGYMGPLSGFEMNSSQLVPTHTVGLHGGTPLIAGTIANGSTITSDGWTASTKVLNKGDLITFAGVFEINPVTYESTGRLQTVTVTADVTTDGSGLATIQVSPSLNDGTGTVLDGEGSSISDKAYQNVSNLPADNAAIVVFGDAGGIYRQNFFWHKNAIGLAMVDLYLPESAASATRVRDELTGLSLSLTTDYNITDHQEISRIDALWGVKMLNPELIFKMMTEKIN